MKHRIYPVPCILLALSFLCSAVGCSSDTQDVAHDNVTQTETSAEQQNSGSSAHKYDGKSITAGEIKEKYDTVDSGVMPMYNVARDEVFTFEFASNLYEVSGEFDFVTVHTDESCSQESLVYSLSEIKAGTEDDVFASSNSTLIVSSAGGVLDTEYERNTWQEKENLYWGNAPIYYLAIRYDTESTTPRKLDKPVVIPFTVKSDVEVPQAKGVVTEDGRFSLRWDAVDGADYYNVYMLTNGTQSTGENNEPVRGAEYGYSECSLLICESVEGTSFEGFAGGDSNLCMHRCSTDGRMYVIGQNYSVNSDYCVTAVVDGKESGVSSFIETAGLALPHRLTDECDIIFNTYESVSELPLTVDVINIDGSVTGRRIRYTLFTGRSLSGQPLQRYAYEIEGTALTGYVTMDVDDISSLPQTVGSFSVSGAAAPDNEISKVPPSDMLPPQTTSDSGDIVRQQRRSTDLHVKSGNETAASTPDGSITVFADSAAEEWLAVNLINGETEISLEAFPSLQNTYTLEDTVNKVYYQNPYILGLYRFSYDYPSMTLRTSYLCGKDELHTKQLALAKETDRIAKSLIKGSMSEEQKQLAVYTYLENSLTYDKEALEAARKSDFVKTKDFAYDDSFSAYGAIVNKEGVCQAYAGAYKLLCDKCGIDCRVCTGYLDGNLPHAWNLVSIEGEWYNSDASNNKNTVGIPYYLYNCDTVTAQSTGFVSDKLFETDGKVSSYRSDNSSRDYYHANGLVADSLSSYEEVLDKNLSPESTSLSIRYTGAVPERRQFINTVRKVYGKHGMEDRLDTLSCAFTTGFIHLEEQQ